jgi:uncharacterized membrane protein
MRQKEILMSKAQSSLVRAAIAGILGAGIAAAGSAAQNPGDQKVHCWGVNSCKGQGSCNSKHNSCGGQNSCKGQGYLEMSQKDCKAKGGSTQEPPINAPTQNNKK